MAAELDDLLLNAKTPFSRRLIVLLLLGMVIAGLGLTGRKVLFSSDETTEAPVQTAEVKKGAVTNSLSLSGTISAESTSQLNFQQAGVVTAVNVKMGQQVKAGEVLAEIDSASANDAVKQAELNLKATQIKLNEMLRGPTPSDRAAADQSLQQANQTLTTAQEELRKLQAGPTASDRSSAMQAVSVAQSALVQAQAARDKLTAPGSNDRSSLESAARQAEGGVRSAENAQRTAENGMTTAQASLYSAEGAFCPDSAVTFCSSRATPITNADEGALLAATASSSSDRGTKASAVLSANAAYKNALNGRSGAVSSLDSARRDLVAAQQKYATTPSGPTSGEVSSADSAVASAKLGVQTAQQKALDLERPDASKLQQAKSALDSAQVGLTAAQIHCDEVYSGAKPSDLELQRNSLSLSQLSLDKARNDLDKTRLLAPFDGTVADLKLAPGDQAQAPSSSSSGSGSSAAITLNTPNALRLDLVVGESDYGKLKVGQKGFVSLSGLDGASFPMEIESIGTLPSTQQGVVTYAARARLITDGLAIVGAGVTPGALPQGAQQVGPGTGTFTITPGQTTKPGQITPNQASPAQGGTSGAPQTVPFAAGAAPPGERPKPAPGMQGQATVITEEKLNVLVVPQRAVTMEGFDSVVKVQKDDGSVEKVKVKTGSRNGIVVEITEGLSEGQKVIIPSAPVPSSGGGGSSSGATQGIQAIPGGGGGNFVIQFGGP